MAPTWLYSQSWHQLAQTGSVSLLPSQHLAGTKTPGERSLEAGLRVGGCNFISSRTGNVQEQTRLPLHLWLMTPNSDFSVLLQTPIHLFTRSLHLDMAGTRITAHIHNGAHHLPGLSPLLPSLPHSCSGWCPPTPPPTSPPRGIQTPHPPHSDFQRPHQPPTSLLPHSYRNSPSWAAAALLVLSALFSPHSQDSSVKSPTSVPQLPIHHWTRHQCHPCPHGAQHNRQMTRMEKPDALAFAWASAALLSTITSIL